MAGVDGDVAATTPEIGAAGVVAAVEGGAESDLRAEE